MRIFRGAEVPWRSADPETFTPVAQTRRLAADGSGVPVDIYHVRFGDRGRTHWHIHSGPQWLLIVEGRVRVQKWGEPAVDVDAGDAVVIAPGEKHWHGAVPGSEGAHFAVNVESGDRVARSGDRRAVRRRVATEAQRHGDGCHRGSETRSGCHRGSETQRVVRVENQGTVTVRSLTAPG